MNHRATILLLAALGCRGGEEEPIEPVPYIADGIDQPAPAESADQLGIWIQQAFDAAMEIDASPIIETYMAVTVDRDDYCPYFFGDDEMAQWYGECDSAGGTGFQGYGGHQLYSDDNYWQEVVYTTGSVVTPDGHVFEGGGTAYRGGGTDVLSDTTTGYMGVLGSFAYDAPDAGWLSTGDATLEKQWQRGEWGQLVAFGGAVTVDERAVAFNSVYVLNVGCAIEPSGVVSVRGEDGWYDVLFDTDFEAMLPSDCDGCGEAWYRGERVGEVCIDVSGLADFEEAPW